MTSLDEGGGVGLSCYRGRVIAQRRAVAQRAAGRFSLNIGGLGGREERYLIVACTVITDVPEAVGP
jgi:hypothetical protein